MHWHHIHSHGGLTAVLNMLQLGVHRSSSIACSVASSGAFSAAAAANSDNSDSRDIAAPKNVKDVAASQSSWSERKPAGRVRSVDVIPEFAPVREESTGEKSDTADIEIRQAPEASDARRSRRSNEFADITTEAFPGAVRKGYRQRLLSTGKAGPKKPVHVGFVQPF